MANLKHIIPFNKDYLSFGVVFVCMALLLLIPLQKQDQIAPQQEKIKENVEIENESPTERIAEPAVITIPKMNLEAPFGTTLGLRASGEVEVPTDFKTVGWYEHSPLPGELGPAVVLGHVDSRDGPSVFFSLGKLVPGDEIIITDLNETERTFVVESSEVYEQNFFPTELVYGDINHAGLRLIICSGWYNREADRYSHNRIVFARLVE